MRWLSEQEMKLQYLIEEFRKRRGLELTGECKKCGQCCEGKIKTYNFDRETMRANIISTYDRVCPHYDETTKECKCYSDDRPILCRMFPYTPEVMYKGCGYKWKCRETNFPEFKGFKKIPRYSRECVITEKIDGTNGVIFIDETGNIFAGSKSRYLWGSIQEEIHNDNQGFAQWVKENKEELLKLGKGLHYGEWWGQGIQRNYGLVEKRFSLFNVSKWGDELVRPKCCGVVPTLAKGMFTTELIEFTLAELKGRGSQAVPGYMNPEGIVIFHVQSGHLYKKTIVGDEKPKGVKDELA